MKALKACNTEAINRFHQRKDHNTEIVETPQDEPPGPPVPENDLPDLPESDLDIPDDPILDFVNSQCHSSEDFGPGSSGLPGIPGTLPSGFHHDS